MKAPNGNTKNYFFNVARQFRQLPYKRISLQSAALWDLRFNALLVGGFVMVGFVVPVDLVVSGFSSQGSMSSMDVMPMAEKLAGRFANALAGAGFNMAFSLGSTPMYTAVLALRRAAGGIQTTGYQARHRRGTNHSLRLADTLSYATFNMFVNALYGYWAGQAIPSWSEDLMTSADIGLAEALHQWASNQDHFQSATQHWQDLNFCHQALINLDL